MSLTHLFLHAGNRYVRDVEGNQEFAYRHDENDGGGEFTTVDTSKGPRRCVDVWCALVCVCACIVVATARKWWVVVWCRARPMLWMLHMLWMLYWRRWWWW